MTKDDLLQKDSVRFVASLIDDRHHPQSQKLSTMLRPLRFTRPSRLLAPHPPPRRPFSTSLVHRGKDSAEPLPSVLENVESPLEITSVLRSGQGFKIRTLANPDDPHTVHGNVIILDGEYFLWRPQLTCSAAGELDIAPGAFGMLDVVAPTPGLSSAKIACSCWYRIEVDGRDAYFGDGGEDYVCAEGTGNVEENGDSAGTSGYGPSSIGGLLTIEKWC